MKPLPAARPTAIAASMLGAGQLFWFGSGELIDDAYITFRYARNWIDGHGPVFNPGDLVEGYTSFVWLASITAAMRAGLTPEVAVATLGVASFFATLAVLWWIAQHPLPRSGSAFLPALLFAANPLTALWAVHGLETTLFGLLVLAAVAVELHATPETRARAAPLSGALLALATLTRPEGAGVFLAQFPFRLQRAVREGRFAELTTWSTAFGGLVSTHLAWRWLFYGELLPNTFYAKLGLSAALVWRGLEYASAYFLSAGGALLVISLAGLSTARERARVIGIPAAALIAAAILEGGDAFPGFRFLVPALPLLYLLVADGCELALLRWRPSLVYACLAPLVLAHVVGSGRSASDERDLATLFTHRMKLVGMRLAEVLPSGTAVAVNPIGAIGFHCAQCRIIDMLGLTDRTIARTPVEDLGYGEAGHERGNGAYVLARRPEIILFGNVLVSSPDAPKGIGLEAPWRPVHRSERELAVLPALESQYVRDWLDLAEDRHLLFLRRRDFALPGARATSP